MQIKKLVLRNFKQYKSLDLDLPEGLLGFVGKNGAGKSTIFDAILYALYGKIDSDKKNIKNDLAAEKESVLVELELEDKGKYYKVVKELKGKTGIVKAELFIDGVSVASSANEVTKQIIKVLKIDSANFKNSFFSRQKDVDSLLNSSSSNRELFLRKMLGMEKLDKLESKIKADCKEKNSVLRGKDGELLSEENVTAIKEEIANIIVSKEEIIKRGNAAKEKVALVTNDYDKVKEDLDKSEKVKESNDKINNQINIVKTEVVSTTNNIITVEAEIENLNKSKLEYEKLFPKKAEYETARADYEAYLEVRSKYQSKINNEEKLAEYTGTIDRLNAEINDCNKTITSLIGVEDKIELNSKLIEAENNNLKSAQKVKDTVLELISSINFQLQQKKERIEKIKILGQDSPCPECERPLHEQYEYLISNYISDIESLEKDIAARKAEHIEAEKEIANVKARIDVIQKQIDACRLDKVKKENASKTLSEKENEALQYKKRMEDVAKLLSELKDVKYSEAELLNKQKLCTELEVVNNRIISLKALIASIPGKEELLSKYKKEKEELLKKNEDLCVRLTKLNFNLSEYTLLKQFKDEKEKELDEAKEMHSDIRFEYQEVDHKLKQKESELKRDSDLRERISEIKKEAALLERLADAVNSFKIKVTSLALPEISSEASRLFRRITRGRYIDLKISSNYDMLVSREDKEVELSTLSGGEKDLASLCFRIAISKKISTMAGRKNLGFFALDEVFGSQDEERREELLGALNEIAKEFKQIFVISHNQDIHESFENKLVFKKSGSFSTVEFFPG